MKPWERYGPHVPKRAPPAHGIRIRKAGTTWWGERWIGALEHVLRGDAGRLARGKTYARAGRTHDLVVRDGHVTSKVTGSRAKPYEIGIELRQFPPATWETAIRGMAAQAHFAAELLIGEMPLSIDEAFHAAGTSLFPTERAELTTSCSCPDSGDPCKHVAATHYVLGEALDRDPFLLFELRGRAREHVLESLRAARAAARGGEVASVDPSNDAAPVPSTTLAAMDATEYDRARQALPALTFEFDAPVASGALLRQLGAPGAWRGEASPAELLAPVVRAAAERARSVALGELPTDAAADEPATNGDLARAKQPPGKRGSKKRRGTQRHARKR